MCSLLTDTQEAVCTEREREGREREGKEQENVCCLGCLLFMVSYDHKPIEGGRGGRKEVDRERKNRENV